MRKHLTTKNIAAGLFLMGLLIIKFIYSSREPPPTPEDLRPKVQAAMQETNEMFAKMVKENSTGAVARQPATPEVVVRPTETIASPGLDSRLNIEEKKDERKEEIPQPVVQETAPDKDIQKFVSLYNAIPEMPVAKTPPVARERYPSDLNSLFVYLRNNDIVVRAKVDSIEGALKLLEIAQRIWERKKVEIVFDEKIPTVNSDLREQACVRIESPKLARIYLTSSGMENCTFFGEIENVRREVAMESSKRLDRVYFTTGPDFSDTYTGLSQPSRERMSFFSLLAELKVK